MIIDFCRKNCDSPKSFRFKIVVLVLVGSMEGQGFRCASRFVSPFNVVSNSYHFKFSVTCSLMFYHVLSFYQFIE